jgi:pimeloyl-ACP methyl ester carboxylesterase
VLVHGIGVTMAQNWAYLSPNLKSAGYCVFALTYGRNPGLALPGGLAPIAGSAAELDAFVARVLASTGAAQVDLVAHSEGTVVSQWWLRRLAGAARTHTFVALDPLYAGTTLFGVADVLDALRALDPAQYARGNAAFAQLCAACAEVLHGSEFQTTLYDDGTVAAAGVTYTNVMTRYDELVVPYTSGRIDSPQATNIVLQDLCPLNLDDHALVVLDPLVSRLVLNALDPLHPVAPSCGPVLGLGIGPISL